MDNMGRKRIFKKAIIEMTFDNPTDVGSAPGPNLKM